MARRDKDRRQKMWERKMGVGVGWEGGWGGDRHVVQKEDESIGEGKGP